MIKPCLAKSKLQAPVKSEPEPQPETFRVRTTARTRASLPAFIIRTGEQAMGMTIHNVSTNGFQMHCEHNLGARSLIWVRLPAVGDVAALVRSYSGDRYGCEFVNPLSERQFLQVMSTPGVDQSRQTTRGWFTSLAGLLKRLFG